MTPRPWAGRSPGRLARQGLTLPRHVITTAHAGAIYPFSLEAGTGVHGVLLGQDRGTGGGFYFDLHAAYDAALIQGPNMIVCGAGAHGKSAIIKTLVYRSSRLRTAGKDRFTAVIDPKGEWVPLAHALGWTVLQLHPGGPTRINPLDLGTTPNSTPTSQTDVISQRVAIATTLLAQTLDQPHLATTDHRLIHAAIRHLTHHTTAERASNAPTLTDLRQLLANPGSDLAADLDTTLPDLLERRRALLDACAVLLEHDLHGICDGPTTLTLDWTATPGLVLDLSALLPRRKTLKMVLTAAAGWLAGIMYTQPHRHKLNIIDEGWAALDDLAIIRYLQDQWRLGRHHGVANILITHALTDLHSQTNDGTAQTKITQGLLNTTSVRVYLHQNPEHIHTLLHDMGLNTTQATLLNRLAPFQALWQIGTHTALVDHIITDTEWAYADTDTAMRGCSDSG
jgi:type IV secretory pathway VirB4 component